MVMRFYSTLIEASPGRIRHVSLELMFIKASFWILMSLLSSGPFITLILSSRPNLECLCHKIGCFEC